MVSGIEDRGQRRWVKDGGLSVLTYPSPDSVTTPVLMLHGIGGNAFSCARAAFELSNRGYTAVSWDAPGYGESSDLQPDADHAGAVIAVLDALGLEEVHLFGTSWGGVIAAQVADRHPGRIATLVLADSTRGSGTDPDAASAMLARSKELATLGAAEFAARRAPKLVAPRASGRVRALVQGQMAEVREEGYAAAARMMATTDNSQILTRLTVPTLILVGESDQVTGISEARRLADLVPGGSLSVISQAGHAAVTERPEAVAEVMTEFFAEHVP